MPIQPGQELSQLDFAALIGSPLNAVIEAQAKAAVTSADFVTQVGFNTVTDAANVTTRTPVVVDFSYKKSVVDPTTGTSSDKNATLSVPLLTILPVPFIRVEEATIEFNAKITATEYREVTDERSLNVNLSAKARFGVGSAKISGSYAQKKTSKSGEKVERDYTMNVKVKAVQDNIPAGLDRILTILESSISEKVAAT